MIALIKTDHKTVNELFRRYRGLSKRAVKSRRRVADRIIKELSVHAAVEELVLYPTARTKIPGGEKLVREALDEHQSLKESLAALERCPAESDAFDSLMAEIRDEVRHHVKEEEGADGILARLRNHASPDELLQMAKLTSQAKQAVPTRPHPKAPNTPPGNVVAATAAGMLDKAKDKLGLR